MAIASPLESKTEDRNGNRLHVFIVALLTLVVSLGCMGIYLRNTLFGHFDQHMLTAKKFGIPQALQDHGLTELYIHPMDSGWDGQFYYFISNDLLGLKDTATHIDNPAYRYQRIGLPLVAKIISFLSFSDWVSPLHYYLASLLLILIATLYLTQYLSARGYSPYMALLWSVGMGTQLTLLNGLPDAAADAWFVISFVGLLESRFWIYFMAATMAALTREGYILFPAVVIICDVFNSYFQSKKSLLNGLHSLLRMRTFLQSLITMFIFASWQAYLRWHFGVFPSKNATGILGFPLQSAFHFIFAGFRDQNPVVSGSAATLEGFGCLLFLFLTVGLFYVCFKELRNNFLKSENLARTQLFLTFASILFLYLCFGPTVMMHFTGYAKVISIFLFLLPFMQVLQGKPVSRKKLAVAAAITAYFYIMFAGARFSPNLVALQQSVEKKTPKFAVSAPACVHDYKVAIEQTSVDTIHSDDFLNSLFPREILKINLKVKNLSQESFFPYFDKGATNISYHWLNKDLRPIKEGMRTPLKEELKPQEETTSFVFAERPFKSGDYVLRVSLVQEGCAWFEEKEPASKLDIPFHF